MTKEQLTNAQDVSIRFFKAIEENKLIVPGKTEAQLNEEVCSPTSAIAYWNCNS